MKYLQLDDPIILEKKFPVLLFSNFLSPSPEEKSEMYDKILKYKDIWKQENNWINYFDSFGVELIFNMYNQNNYVLKPYIYDKPELYNKSKKVIMNLNKKSMMYIGLGGLAVYFLFFRKKKDKPASDEEMSNFLSKRSRTEVRAKLKGAKDKLKTYIKRGGAGGAIKRKLVGRVKNLSTQLKRNGEAKRRKKVGFVGDN